MRLLRLKGNPNKEQLLKLCYGHNSHEIVKIEGAQAFMALIK